MKKLALVLGSLLVVGSVASAKEVVPAPVAVPETVVKVVEKPVIVYRDRAVEAGWRPNGSVDVHSRFWGEVEGADDKDYRGQLRTTAFINFTENQSLEIATRNNYGLKSGNNMADANERLVLTHTYNFANIGKIAPRLETEFKMGKENYKHLQVKPVFDFSGYFFENDYVKANALELAPVFKHAWTRSDDYADTYALYANAEFDLPLGLDFQAEFDNLFAYTKPNDGEATKTGAVDLILGRTFPLYAEGRHALNFRAEAEYEFEFNYKKVAGEDRWQDYEAKFEPSLNYTFKATEFVNLYARVAGEYVNRNTERHSANHWRWQPTARLGFKATF